mgnify:CR=1 FL=1
MVFQLCTQTLYCNGQGVFVDKFAVVCLDTIDERSAADRMSAVFEKNPQKLLLGAAERNRFAVFAVKHMLKIKGKRTLHQHSGSLRRGPAKLR